MSGAGWESHELYRSREAGINFKAPNGHLRPICAGGAAGKPSPGGWVTPQVTHEHPGSLLNMQVQKASRANTLKGVEHLPLPVKLFE